MNFNADKEDVKTFKKFYQRNDASGKVSMLIKTFEPDDKKIKKIDFISQVVLYYSRLLHPLYNLISYRPMI